MKAIEYIKEIKRELNKSQWFLVRGIEIIKWCEQFEEEYYSLYPQDKRTMKPKKKD